MRESPCPAYSCIVGTNSIISWGTDAKQKNKKNYKKVKKTDRKAKIKSKVHKVMGKKDD